MTPPDIYTMSREELRAYLLEHRDDEIVFHAYMNKLATEPVLATRTIADLENEERFAELLAQAIRRKQAR